MHRRNLPDELVERKGSDVQAHTGTTPDHRRLPLLQSTSMARSLFMGPP